MLVCCLVCVSMTTTWGRKPLQKSRSSRRTFTWTGISTEIRKDVTASEQAANTRMKNLQPSAWKASASNFTLKLKLKRIESKRSVDLRQWSWRMNLLTDGHSSCTSHPTAAVRASVEEVLSATAAVIHSVSSTLRPIIRSATTSSRAVEHQIPGLHLYGVIAAIRH